MNRICIITLHIVSRKNPQINENFILFIIFVNEKFSHVFSFSYCLEREQSQLHFVCLFLVPAEQRARLHEPGWPGFPRCLSLLEASQPGGELNLVSTVFAESCCFENDRNRRMF